MKEEMEVRSTIQQIVLEHCSQENAGKVIAALFLVSSIGDYNWRWANLMLVAPFFLKGRTLQKSVDCVVGPVVPLYIDHIHQFPTFSNLVVEVVIKGCKTTLRANQRSSSNCTVRYSPVISRVSPPDHCYFITFVPVLRSHN